MTDKQIIIDAFNSAWNRKVATESSYGKLASKEVFENNNEDKQIIIDGVDVSGCKHYDDLDCYAQRDNCGYPLDCKDHPNCYYKQLKRKEQECERLKEAIKTKTGKDYINEIQDITMKYECHQKSMGVCWWGKYGKETKCIGIRECHKRELEVIQKLETTLNQLKAENDELRQFLSKEPLAIQALQKSYESYQKSTEVFSDWVKDYKQLITEIKEIAEKIANYYDGDEYELMRKDAEQILQKISECEGNDGN